MRGFVVTTDLKFEAVIRPSLCKCHSLVPACPWVDFSRNSICSGLT